MIKYLKSYKDIIYILTIVIGLVLMWANQTNSVNKNTEINVSQTEEIKELQTTTQDLQVQITSYMAETSANIQNINKILEGKYGTPAKK